MRVKLSKVDPLVKTLVGRVAGGAAIGGAAGGFAGHRLQKRKAERYDPVTHKTHKVTTVGGALKGAYLGGLIGLQHGAYAGGIDRSALKNAKSAWKASGHPFKDRHEGALGAAAGASLLGAAGYAIGKSREKAKEPTKRGDRWAGAAAGAAMGGGYGHMIGTMHRVQRVLNHQAKTRRHQRTDADGNFNFGSRGGGEVKAPAWAKGAKTKADAKKAYRTEAMKHHPDRGGNAEKMKQVNTEWESFEKSDHFRKLAMVLPSFLDELSELY